MIGFFAMSTILTAVIFAIGLAISINERWTWISKAHEYLTIGCAIAAVIFSTILNIIS